MSFRAQRGIFPFAERKGARGMPYHPSFRRKSTLQRTERPSREVGQYNRIHVSFNPVQPPKMTTETDEPTTTTSASQDYGIVEQLPNQEDFWRPPRRFGAVPVETEPLGWDRRQGFRKHYPLVNLPTQIVERVSFGRTDEHEPNRLIWGDNLHIMRQIPSNSVDLVYIDPPFFSGRQYNVLWGDANEHRSFNDIWEDGMPGYLTWLNARLYEMKRLLKPTGSIYVHCDWHASHYIKVEMDKIFGYENFRNEVIWHYRRWTGKAKRFQRLHDVVFFYSASANYTFNQLYTAYTAGSRARKEQGVLHRFKAGETPHLVSVGEIDRRGVSENDVWHIPFIAPSAKERIGYPTQKPEALLERIIRSSSNEQDIVFDAFAGGGTTVAVAQRLNRRWIACDQSRVAVAVTAERLKQGVSQTEIISHSDQNIEVPDFTVEHWGVYEANRLSDMPPDEFRQFILHSYGATRLSDGDDGLHIHGWHNNQPVWVGQPGQASQASATDVGNFANAILQTTQYRDAFLRDGTMLAWAFHPDARTAADNLRQREGIQVQFVRLQQIRIGSTDFREHVVGKSTDRADYSEFLTFVHPPNIDVGHRNLGNGSVTFDASGTAVINSEAEIINVQWDFNYRDRFEATPGYSFQRDRNKKPQLQVTHKFDRMGSFDVACRIQDSKGGEGTQVIKIEVK